MKPSDIASRLESIARTVRRYHILQRELDGLDQMCIEGLETCLDDLQDYFDLCGEKNAY